MKARHVVLLVLLALPGSAGVSHAHTIDSVGDYRVEIGWMNEPVVSGETNAIEFYASPLEQCPDLDPIKCAESQGFRDGITGLKETLKLKLIFRDDSITLPFSPDHNIPGKYYAFVNPTVSGFYQANILGTIQDTPISLSMHPPKVSERAYIEFPEPADLDVTNIIEKHAEIISDLETIKADLAELQEAPQGDPGYAGIGLGVAGIAAAAVALARTKR